MHVFDALTGTQAEIKTKEVLNCTGPFSDSVRLAANSELSPRISASKGVHLTLPLPEGMQVALMIPKTSDGRLLFAIPFQGVLMLGTTDTPSKTIDIDPKLQADEVSFLLDGLNQYVGSFYTSDQVKAGFGGLRPLISEPGRGTTKQLLRDHEVEVDSKSGLVSLLGGKWTTYRVMAKDAVDEICRRRNKTDVCRTDELLLPGAEAWLPDGWKSLHQKYSSLISKQTAEHLHQNYGNLAYQVAALWEERPELAELVCEGSDAVKAEVVYHARYEMAQTIEDVLSRRLRIEYTDFDLAYRAAGQVGFLLGEELNWPDGKAEESAAAYFQYIHAACDAAGINIDRA